MAHLPHSVGIELPGVGPSLDQGDHAPFPYRWPRSDTGLTADATGTEGVHHAWALAPVQRIKQGDGLR